jgi:CRISPR/Cas system-associated endonuclease/helicase Cas3
MKKTLKGFTVYLDLDGVMANFDKAWYDSYGFTKDDWEYRQEHVAKKAPFFFLELEEMPDAVKLSKSLLRVQNASGLMAKRTSRRELGSPNASVRKRKSSSATGKRSRSTPDPPRF